MFKTRKSVQINRSPQDVFDYVNDPANDANWQGPIESSRWTSEGPPINLNPVVLGGSQIVTSEVDSLLRPKNLITDSLVEPTPGNAVPGDLRV
jgi:hypothetical protein